SEAKSLSSILSKLHGTLETLHLLGASTPVDALRDLDWPHLTTLIINADPPTGDLPHARLLPRMELLARARHRASPPLASGCSGPFPWPRLERLVIACPNAQDEVYEHLPPTLRALSLRHWKFAWLHEGLVPSLYHSSGAMLAILRRCAAADIERLEIEYRADSTSEDAM
ncbi:uncharacterized protein BXZ73DRAFT_22399, partial [Epithele typhae]|uniref:uncharacterized protein n=1 Tax=Epithele typhae TaxID=378194 RepID=UPI0020072F40